MQFYSFGKLCYMPTWLFVSLWYVIWLLSTLSIWVNFFLLSHNFQFELLWVNLFLLLSRNSHLTSNNKYLHSNYYLKYMTWFGFRFFFLVYTFFSFLIKYCVLDQVSHKIFFALSFRPNVGLNADKKTFEAIVFFIFYFLFFILLPFSVG